MVDRKPNDQSWQSFAEKRLQQALRSGAFEDLPGFGKPLAFDNPHDDNWWLKDKLRRERINCLPPALAIRVDVEKTLAGLAQLADERAVRRTIEQLNGRIEAAQRAAVWGPPCTTQRLDVDAVIRRWRERVFDEDVP